MEMTLIGLRDFYLRVVTFNKVDQDKTKPSGNGRFFVFGDPAVLSVEEKDGRLPTLFSLFLIFSSILWIKSPTCFASAARVSTISKTLMLIFPKIKSW